MHVSKRNYLAALEAAWTREFPVFQNLISGFAACYRRSLLASMMICLFICKNKPGHLKMLAWVNQWSVSAGSS